MVLLSSSTAWAQDGSVTTAPPASSVPVGKDGFRIDGNDKPALYKEYEYHREMPDEENVYWHLEGVEVVNGAPVRMYPDGSLDANKFQTLTIQWDDSATTRKLQLRRGYKDETEVLAELLVRGTSITNQIMYHGQAPNYTPKVHSTAIYTCAWNPVDPVTGTVSGEPHHFQMESNCSGNTGQLWAPCSSRPNFVWTIRYYTASGTFFQEQLCDFTSGDFSKMWIYFYSKIPYPYYATPIPGVFPYPGTVNNATTTGWHGNGNVFRWPDIVSGGTCGWSVTRTATPGDAITRIHMECTGYSCGWSLRPDNDAIDIYYLGLPPAPIALVNSTDPELCRSRTYQVETAGTIGAVGYAWAADNGARLLAIPGTGSGRMTLDLGNVPNSANSVTVTVQPSAGSQVCTGFPQVTSYTFQLQRPPANPVVLLPSDNCPSLTPKLIQVAALDATAQYRWRVTGTAGAYFVSPSGNSMTPPDGPGIIGLVTPRIGDATITVTAIGPQCRGTSAATTQVFNIGNILPAAPTLLVGRSGCISMQNNVTLSIQSPIPGLTYQIGRPFNAVNTTGSPVSATIPTPVVASSVVMAWSGARGFFDIDVTVTSQCPYAVQTFTLASNFVQKFIEGPVFCRPAPGGGSGPSVGSEAATVVYPNPTDGTLTIRASDETIHYQWVKVMDGQGRVVQEQQAGSPAGITELNIAALPAGLYQVQLFDGTHLTTQRMVRQ